MQVDLEIATEGLFFGKVKVKGKKKINFHISELPGPISMKLGKYVELDNTGLLPPLKVKVKGKTFISPISLDRFQRNLARV